MNDVTRILSAIEQGDPQAAEQLLPLVYDELRKLAAQRLAQEKPGQTLQATALVHEAYLRLVGAEEARRWDSRGHFFAAAAEAMRRILVENARRKRAEKHGGGRQRVDLDDVEIAADGRPPTTSSPSTRPSTQLDAEDRPPGGRARQAPLLRRPDASRRPPRRSASRRATADRHWAYARAWLRERAAARAGLTAEPENRNSGDSLARSGADSRIACRTGRAAIGVRPMSTSCTSDDDLHRGPGASTTPTDRAAYLDAGLRRRRRAACVGSRGCSPAHAEAGELPREPPPSVATATVDRRLASSRRPRHGHRPLQAAGADRRGGHGRRLRGRADPARPPQGGAEDHQAGHGHEAGHRPVRGRAPGPGDDGPPQHRQGPRRRRHRIGPALLRHGAGPRHPDHRLLRPRAALDPRAAGAVRPGLPGRAARPPEGDHPPRPQALEHPGDGHRRRRRCPRSSTSASPRPPAQRLTEQDALHRLRTSSSARRCT